MSRQFHYEHVSKFYENLEQEKKSSYRQGGFTLVKILDGKRQ